MKKSGLTGAGAHLQVSVFNNFADLKVCASQIFHSFCGLPGALSLMKAAPDRVPPEVEVKVTFIVQKPPGCKVPSQFTPPARNGWRRHRFVMSASHLGGRLRTLGWVRLGRG